MSGEQLPDGGHANDDDDFDNDGWEQDCSVCGGEGEEECNDPIQCTRSHDSHGFHPCPACNGSGLAKDQTLW